MRDILYMALMISVFIVPLYIYAKYKNDEEMLKQLNSFTIPTAIFMILCVIFIS